MITIRYYIASAAYLLAVLLLIIADAIEGNSHE